MEVSGRVRIRYDGGRAGSDPGGGTVVWQDYFTDRVDDEEGYMIQEFVRGWVRDRKVRLEAYEYDIIHAEHEVYYELDCWFGILLDDRTIKGISEDDQGVEGYFVFEKVEE